MSTLIGPRRRRAWRQHRAQVLLDDLNGMYPSLAAGPPLVSAEEMDRRRAAARARVGRYVLGARWTADDMVAAAWRYVETVTHTDELFAPAILLLALAPDQAAVKTWAASLPSEVMRVVELVSASGHTTVCPSR